MTHVQGSVVQVSDVAHRPIFYCYRNDGIEGFISPIDDNPYVDAEDRSALRLNINTNQTGRTFEDHSHIFKLLSRPAEIKSNKIFNVNVRGNRGNILEMYPAWNKISFPTTYGCLQQTPYIHSGLGPTHTTKVRAEAGLE